MPQTRTNDWGFCFQIRKITTMNHNANEHNLDILHNGACSVCGATQIAEAPIISPPPLERVKDTTAEKALAGSTESPQPRKLLILELRNNGDVVWTMPEAVIPVLEAVGMLEQAKYHILSQNVITKE